MVVLAGSYVGFDGGTLQFQYRDRLMSHLPSISFLFWSYFVIR